MKNLKEKILRLAKSRRPKIAVGILKPSNSITNSLVRCKELAEIQVIGSKISGFKNIPATNQNLEEKEIDLILSGKVNGLIRGQADTYKFEDLLARKGGYARSKILNSGFVEDQFGRTFFTSSMSHSEGWTTKSKILMTDELIKKIEKLNVKPKIAFLTWVRPGSVGRNFFFDQTWEQAEYLVNHYQERHLEARNYNIEIETALNEGCNLIVFANGASGNIFFRTLAFLTKNPFYFYFHVGIKENIIENNRTVQDYENFILSACAFANQKK